MTDRDPTIPFFDDHPRFAETSKTGPSLHRLNARYTGLIHHHRHLIEGATVLDLASHDGRFSFGALAAGAARVIGVEVDGDLVEKADANLAACGVDADRYEFVHRDMFRHFDDLDHVDVVFCFGVFYHVNDHMQLLSNIAGVEPRWVLLDTKVSQLDGAVIELRSMTGESPPTPGAHIEGYPTRAAIEVMTATLGWDGEYFDWSAAGLDRHHGMDDYAEGHRVTYVARGTEPISPELRDYAVGLVEALQKDRSTQWMTVKGVAAKCEVNPHALRSWVLRAEGDRPDAVV